jgi:CRP-like cAMP-binding protein
LFDISFHTQNFNASKQAGMPVSGQSKHLIHTSRGNRLLDALARARPALLELAVPTTFKAGDELYSQGGAMPSVFFPTTGVLSALFVLSTGQSAESQTVGSEGFVGLPVYLGLKRSPYRVVQQVAGEILGIPSKAFCDCIAGSKRATTLLKHFTAFSLNFSYYNGVCNLHHSVRQRVSRWLLTAADRSGSSHIRLTQSVLAEMLGVRRQTIGEITLALQNEGLVRNTRGSLCLMDKPALEALACECYQGVQGDYKALVGSVI